MEFRWTAPEADALARDLSPAQRSALQKAASAPGTGGLWLNARPDAPDFRDRPYHAGLINLPTTLLPDPAFADLEVRDQGHLSACTGMAVATVVDLARLRMWRASGAPVDPRPRPVSARMLYELGRSHDQFVDGLPGSSLRGVLRGFFHNGVAEEIADEDDPDHLPEFANWRFTIARARSARNTLLGAYARLSHVLLDYQTALVEYGAIAVSARIHNGWAIGGRLDKGRIGPVGYPEGGHAVTLLGYTREGFLIRNSWGANWSRYRAPDGSEWPGIALWPYDDWRAHVLDAWVMTLAPPTTLDPRSTAGFHGGGAHPEAGHGTLRIAVNGHYLHLRDSRFNRRGTFQCDLASICETADLLRGTGDYDHLLIIAESGLEPLEAVAARAAAWIPALKQTRIYPFFVWWREDIHALAAEILSDRRTRLVERGGGLPALTNRLLMDFARDFMAPIWRSYVGEAERSFAAKGRADGWDALSTLFGGALGGEHPLKLHILAHGAGAVWAAHAARRMARRGALLNGEGKTARLSSLSLVAPICAPSAFEGRALRCLWRTERGGPNRMAVYTLEAEDDARDSVGAFEGSFVDLARHCFPDDEVSDKHPGARLNVLGHAGCMEDLMSGDDKSWHKDCDWFIATEAPVGAGARTHRTLFFDSVLMQHVCTRIIGTESPELQLSP
ncbi:C1 family peptidase [Halomonas sp. BM-2019]|uniref:C1 family peptidase n=1 Tax=Halomonas sp. BM-2019 TaxID=2811227 RepID=UPI001B3C22E8|nr:MAG: C1 family peptidase [Halomonas sp. BM-2019]